jgi:hypothetical protein
LRAACQAPAPARVKMLGCLPRRKKISEPISPICVQSPVVPSPVLGNESPSPLRHLHHSILMTSLPGRQRVGVGGGGGPLLLALSHFPRSRDHWGPRSCQLACGREIGSFQLLDLWVWREGNRKRGAVRGPEALGVLAGGGCLVSAHPAMGLGRMCQMTH